MWHFVFAALATLGMVIPAVPQVRPSLDGTWSMVKDRSQYPAESATEVIHQRGAVIDISFTEKWPGHPNAPMQLHLTADGKPTTALSARTRSLQLHIGMTVSWSPSSKVIVGNT